MHTDWFELHLQVPAAGVDLLSQELAAIGSSGVIVEERRLDTFIPPDPDEAPEDSYELRIFFPAEANPAALRQRLADLLLALAPNIPGLPTTPPEFLPVRNEDWAEGWKQHFSVLHLGQLVIRPTWEEYTPAAGEAVVTLDPGMAFGTGTHGTTRLCLEALAELFAAPSPPQRVLDVGTGSGILAIAAAALGAHRVLACDIDPQACQTARENAAMNGVTERVEITAQPLENLEGDFQVVLANILAEENVRLANELFRRLAVGGTLVLSGILQEKEALVAACFSSLPLHGPVISRRDEWSCLLYRKS